MGYDIERATISFRIKKDHGPRQEADEKQLAWLKGELRDLLDDPEITVVSDYTGLE